MIFAINAGHHVELDSGAIGKYGLREADVTNRVAEMVVEGLNKAGHEAYFIQENELSDITDAANALPADRFLSIHCNAAENPAAYGAEIFTTPGETDADAMATSIMDEVTGVLPDIEIRSDYADGDVDKEANFYVLRYTDAPAALIELAFISNPVEEAYLSNDEFLQKYADAIIRGLLK